MSLGNRVGQRIPFVRGRIRSTQRLKLLNLELALERDCLSSDNDRLSHERDSLGVEIENLARDFDSLSSENDGLRARVEDLESQLATRDTSEVVAGYHKDLVIKRLNEVEKMQLHRLSLVAGNVAGMAARYDENARALRMLSGTGQAHGEAKTLYLDLLESALTGTLWDDPSIEPWGDGGYDPAKRAIGGDWPATAATMIGTARMRNIRTLVERVVAEAVPGDLLEAGAWRGGACIYMRGILAALGDGSRRVFVADSFGGLPEPDEATYPADAHDVHHTYKDLAVPRREVEERFRRFGLLDDRVVFLEGWFKDTLPSAPIERLSVLRLDGDMYESTTEALTSLYYRVSPGGFVIVDDYNLEPCARAIGDYRASAGITEPIHDIDGAGAWWQVQAGGGAL